MLKTIEFTKDCGYEIRSAWIFVKDGFYRAIIEGPCDIYELETVTFEEAIAFVKRYGFIEG